MTQITPSVHNVNRIAVALAFLEQGLVFISLTTKMPELQEKFGLSPGGFSGLMLALVLASGAGSLLGEKIAPKRGSAMTLRIGFACMTAALPFMAMAPTILMLGVAMVLYGVALGLVDAGCNMQGVALEHLFGRTIMPTFHAAWTLGGILGTVGAVSTHGMSFETSAIGLACVPAILIFAPFLKGGAPVVAIGDDGTAVPWKRILPVGAAMVLFYMVDTSVTAWGPTYMDHVFAAGGVVVALAALPYLVASLAGRSLGDGLTARFGAVPLVRSAAVAGCLGLAAVVFAPSPWAAMVGFLILGFGIAVVAPLSFSAAASIARETISSDDPAAVRARVDSIIARFNQFNYLGAILGAVMTGAVGNDTLRVGFAIPMALILFLAPLAKSFRGASPVPVEVKI